MVATAIFVAFALGVVVGAVGGALLRSVWLLQGLHGIWRVIGFDSRRSVYPLEIGWMPETMFTVSMRDAEGKLVVLGFGETPERAVRQALQWVTKRGFQPRPEAESSRPEVR